MNVRCRLRQQGLTEFFFESAEPTFDELAPARFFKGFREGTYEIEGLTLYELEFFTGGTLDQRVTTDLKPHIARRR